MDEADLDWTTPTAALRKSLPWHLRLFRQAEINQGRNCKSVWHKKQYDCLRYTSPISNQRRRSDPASVSGRIERLASKRHEVASDLHPPFYNYSQLVAFYRKRGSWGYLAIAGTTFQLVPQTQILIMSRACSELGYKVNWLPKHDDEP